MVEEESVLFVHSQMAMNATPELATNVQIGYSMEHLLAISAKIQSTVATITPMRLITKIIKSFVKGELEILVQWTQIAIQRTDINVLNGISRTILRPERSASWNTIVISNLLTRTTPSKKNMELFVQTKLEPNAVD